MIDFGHGIKLGPIDSGDLEQMRYWRNQPAVYKWCRQNDLISDVDQKSWYEKIKKDPSIKMYLVKFQGDSVGVCGFTSIDPYNRRAEFSLYIKPDMHGLGLGRKALMTLLDHGYRNLGFNLIWGESFEGNPAVKLFDSLGFQREGVRRSFYFKNGKFIDAHLFSMEATEWKHSA